MQVETDLAPGLHRIEELDRMPSSCPVLFAWDGKKYAFVSDLLGVGGLGYLVVPGQYADPDPTENFLLPHDVLAQRAGRYELKLTEPMQELTYLDRIRLVAYDLPPGWRLTLDERLAVHPPHPTGEPRFYRRLVSPQRATNERGEDVTQCMARVDLQASPVGELDRRFLGKLAGEHVLTLEFAEPLDAASGDPLLLAEGWVEFPYSQTAFAAWQAREGFRAPTLEARDAAGQWHVVLAEFGYPGGMPRAMSAPLHNLPQGASALRLRTNQEIYWDRLAVAYAEPCPEVRRRELPLHVAEVQECGFMPRIVLAQQRPTFEYGQRVPLAETRDPAGYYTRFGPVEELVAEADNALAIFGPGEELHASFDAPEACRKGWTRRFVVETIGWCKDMDPYTGDGRTVEPLPSHGSIDARRERLHAKYNTRYQAGR
jgi:hypothetical protein